MTSTNTPISDIADGRNQRSLRTRQRIIDAALRLCEAGNLNPTAQQVASEAKTGLRTVFRLFDDVETLFTVLNAELAQRFLDQFQEQPPAAELGTRIDQLTIKRSDAWEELSPFVRSTYVNDWRYPITLDRYRENVDNIDKATLKWLPEAKDLAVPNRDLLLNTLSFEFWNSLRRYRGKTLRQSRDIVRCGVYSALGLELPVS